MKVGYLGPESSFSHIAAEKVFPKEELISVGSIVKLSLINANLGIVNVCSGKPIAIKDLIGKWLIKNNWNIDLDLGFYQYSNCESFCFWGDAQKLKSILKSYLL